MDDLNLNPIGPTQRISSAAIGANFDMVKAAFKNLSADDIPQTAIAGEDGKPLSVNGALGTLNEKLENIDASQVSYTFPNLEE